MLISWLLPDSGLSGLFLILDSALYQAVSWLYNLFLKVAQSEIFTSEVYENFSQRVYIVLGVVMLFVLAYALLQAIVNPDNFTKGDKSFSKAAMNLVVALIILGLLPTIFDYSRKLQNFVLDSNLIGILLFGGEDLTIEVCDSLDRLNCEMRNLSSSEVAKAKIDSYGNVMALTTLNAFLNPENTNFEYDASSYLADHNKILNPFFLVGCVAGGAATIAVSFYVPFLSPSISAASLICGGVGAAGNAVANSLIDVKHYTWNDVRASILLEQNGGFTQIVSMADVLKKGAKDVNGDAFEITYMPFVSSACACVIIYLLISFCIDLGIRTVRLAFLQLIAPIPVFMKAMPGKGTQFDKWMKKTIATYMEVFIRIFLMYMVVYFLSNLQGNLSTREGLWVNVIIIMGLFAFVKEAPKLISEITGIDSGNMKLGIMPKLAAGGALAGAALAGGALTAGIKGLTHTWKNTTNAFKDTPKNASKWKKFGNAAKAGGMGLIDSGFELISGGLRSGYGARSAKNIADVRKATSEGIKGALDARDKRESYRVTHAGEVGIARAKDIMDSVKSYMGISNIDDLKRQQSVLQDIFSKRKAAADAAESEVIKKAGKRLVSAGKEVTADGMTFKRLADIDNIIDTMKNKGTDAQGTVLTPAELATKLTEYQNARENLKDNLVNDYLNGFDEDGQNQSINNMVGPVKEALTSFNTALKNNINVVTRNLSDANLSDPNMSKMKKALEQYVNDTRNMSADKIIGNAQIDLAKIADTAKKVVGTASGNVGTQVNEYMQKEAEKKGK